MSKVKIIGNTASTCVKRVLTICLETNTDYEIVPIDFGKGEHKSPEYVEKYQPFGRVPAFEDDGFRLFESRAICRYIAEKANSELYPKDLKKRALVETWLSVESSEFKPAENVAYEYVFKPVFFNQEPDDNAGKVHIEKMHEFFKVFDKHLSKNKYCIGDEVTLADLSFLPYLNVLLSQPKFEKLLEPYPNVDRWYKDISSRPSWQKVLTL